MCTTKGKNILIVNDDEDLTNLYETFLKYDGYKVDAFTDPTMLCILLKKMYMILLYLI
jgi:DNA-binding response OmpR family regulator